MGTICYSVMVFVSFRHFSHFFLNNYRSPLVKWSPIYPFLVVTSSLLSVLSTLRSHLPWAGITGTVFGVWAPFSLTRIKILKVQLDDYLTCWAQCRCSPHWFLGSEDQSCGLDNNHDGCHDYHQHVWCRCIRRSRIYLCVSFVLSTVYWVLS